MLRNKQGVKVLEGVACTMTERHKEPSKSRRWD
jgi:hypothetical protein